MPIRKKRGGRRSGAAAPLGAGAVEFFSAGDFFDGEDYFKATTPEERKAHWAAYKSLYIQKFHENFPQHKDGPCYGEELELRGEL